MTNKSSWGLATLAATAWLAWGWARSHVLLPPDSNALLPWSVISSLFFAYMLLFTRWGMATWQRFRPPQNDNSLSRITHRIGARGFGLGSATLMSALCASNLAGPFSFTLTNLERLTFYFSFCFDIFLPVSLWMGYFWGRTMAWFFHVT